MDSEKRRIKLLTLLSAEGEPVTGTELAALFGVSRQVIVQDIAILRATGERVLATPQGYLIPRLSTESRFCTVVTCKHTMEQIEHEIGIVVDLGGKVLDVIVEHPVYGELRGSLMISSRRDLSIFLERLVETAAKPLSALTDGVHLHTLEAPDSTVMQEIIQRLRTAGLLAIS
jgi:hypothetical protein